MGYLPLTLKDPITHMHGLAVYVKEGLPFARYLSLQNSKDYYVSNFRYFTHCLGSFPSIDHLLRLYGRFLILFNLTKMKYSRSTHWLMSLSLKTLIIFIIRTI